MSMESLKTVQKSAFDLKQERRKQESKNAFKTSKPEQPTITVKVTVDNALLDMLSTVRPDWSDADLASVQEKLADIDIETTDDLKFQLHQFGPQKLNEQLKAKGHKAIRMDTLKQLKNTCECAS
uniref:Uncharacterized protein n=1 Tax=Alexandrium andersonii TaxID=327968 RepID=A0A7S2AQC1_9DINO|mmetsp:Transcript_16478/g.37187  ORF Transcript_16478/g.37187 Transcript_16478/m.37187 type:complete len:124 (+) Transcript_16478:1-372(+)